MLGSITYYEPQRPRKINSDPSQFRFPVVTLPFYGEVSLGNGTQYTIGSFRTPRGRLFVGIEGKGSYTFGNWCHFNYAMEKLNLKFEGDAANIADWINTQLGHIENGEQGKYDERFCEESGAV